VGNGRKDEKYDWYYVRFVFAAVAFAVVFGFIGYETAVRTLGKHYEIERQRAEYKEDISDVIMALSEAKSQCQAQQPAADKADCDSLDVISNQGIELLNLANNRRIAKLTEGTVDVAVLQIWLTVAAFILLAITVYQTGRALQEARIATGFAFETLRQAKETTEVELQPYLSLEFVECHPTLFGAKPGEEMGYGFSFTIRVKNSGKSPASRLVVEIEGGTCHFDCLKRIPGQDIPDIEASMPINTGTISETEFLIPANDHRDISFSLPCFNAPVQGQPTGTAMFANQTIDNEYVLFWVHLDEVTVRYKDFICQKQDFHKVARGLIDETFDGARSEVKSKGILWNKTSADDEHEHYQKETVT